MQGFKLKFETSSDKQKQAARAWIDPEVTEIVYGGAKGGGKSYLGVSLIFGNALIYPNTRYFIARKKLNDLRKHTVPTIEKVFSDWGIPIEKYAKFNGMDNLYECYNGSIVLLIEAKWMPSDPMYERFGSMTMTQGWIEECGEFEEIAKKNLAISIGRWENDKYNLKRKLLMTCNPKKNFLYKNYYLPWKNKTLDKSKVFIQAFADENTKNEKGYVDQLKENLTDRDRQRLLEGNWEYSDDDNALIEYEKIIDCFTNNHVPEGKRCITSDVARLGGDRVVIIEWNGWRAKVKAWKRLKLTQTATLLESTRTRIGCGKSDVLIDADGLGVGLEDFVGYKGFINNARPLQDPSRPMDASGKPVPENFDMLKSQCYFRLAHRINQSGLYIECEDDETRQLIIDELEQVKQKDLDSDMKKGVIPKDKVKETLGRSPDFADALMMREWFDLKPKFVMTATSI